MRSSYVPLAGKDNASLKENSYLSEKIDDYCLIVHHLQLIFNSWVSYAVIIAQLKETVKD